MKKIFLLILLIIIPFSAKAFAQSAITVGGYIACFTESDFKDIIKFVAAKDVDSGQAYLDQKRCFVLKKGLRVTVMEYGFSKVQCAFKGIKFWTVREAITNYQP